MAVQKKTLSTTYRIYATKCGKVVTVCGDANTVTVNGNWTKYAQVPSGWQPIYTQYVPTYNGQGRVAVGTGGEVVFQQNSTATTILAIFSMTYMVN